VLIGGAANAQNFDQGKSVARLFADNCATCHRSARGLAKGRFSLTLFLFLQKHYTSNSGSAWALTSYLESVDSAQLRAAAAKPSPPATRTVLDASARVGAGALGRRSASPKRRRFVRAWSASGQKRRFDWRPVTSGLPRPTDILSRLRHATAAEPGGGGSHRIEVNAWAATP